MNLAAMGSLVIGLSLLIGNSPMIGGAASRKAAHPLRRVGREFAAAPPAEASSAEPASAGRGCCFCPAVFMGSGSRMELGSFTESDFLMDQVASPYLLSAIIFTILR